MKWVISALHSRLPGQFLDAESGLFHNDYRDYDPKVGRYVESDPLGLGAGWNTYGYVGENPVNATDPLGLDEVLVSLWLPRLNEGAYVGHVALSTLDMQETYTSQWPVGIGQPNGSILWNRNRKSDMADTRRKEGGRLPDMVYAVNVPNMQKFKETAYMRAYGTDRWGMLAGFDPTGYSTNCAEAAVDALHDGGFWLLSDIAINTPAFIASELYWRSKFDPTVRKINITTPTGTR